MDTYGNDFNWFLSLPILSIDNPVQDYLLFECTDFPLTI